MVWLRAGAFLLLAGLGFLSGAAAKRRTSTTDDLAPVAQSLPGSHTPDPAPHAPDVERLRDEFLSRTAVRQFIEESRGARSAADLYAAGGGRLFSPALPARGQCIREACRRLGPLGCDDTNDVLEIARLCSGNYSGECVQAACDYLGRFGCDEFFEVSAVVAACRFSFGRGCLDASCRLAGALACQSGQEVVRVLQACAGNFGGECIRVVCGHLGKLECGTLEEVSRVAAVCGSSY